MNTLPFSQRPSETSRAGNKHDAMMEFHSESPARRYQPRKRRPMRWVAGVAIFAGLTVASAWAYRNTRTGAPADGTLRIESEPSGAAVEVDGTLRGLTPLTLTLAAGAHPVVVSLEAQKQDISATVTAGVQSVHHLRFSGDAGTSAAPGTDRGRLQVISDPAGAMVNVDGVARGVAPIFVDGLEPGEHHVTIDANGKTQKRVVSVEAGATASLVVTNAPAGSESGWMVAKAPTSLQIFEGGKLIGSTDTDRIMLSAGIHNLEFVADALGFRARRNVTIVGGQTTTAAVSLPQAQVNLNAVPWAEAFVDGTSAGQTPIANMLLTIGPHDVEFRHPELGAKRVKLNVSLTEPARVAVDMRAR